MTPRIIGVYVHHFKNLSDLWLPWNQRAVLIGPNGVGKTNLLECCALLMGTRQTKELVQRRVPRGLAYELSVVIADVPILPGPSWWRTLDAAPDESLSEVVTRAAAGLGATQSLLGTLELAVGEGLVRYRVQGVDGKQVWSTTLVTTASVDKLVVRPSGSGQGNTDSVPTPFAPLMMGWRAGQPKGRDKFRDVLQLPPSDDPPVDLQWLPTTRTGAEIIRDLNSAVLDAAWDLGVRASWRNGTDEGRTTLMDCLTEIQGDGPKDADVLTRLWPAGELAARDELHRTMPGLSEGLHLTWNFLDINHLESSVDDGQLELAALRIGFSPDGPLRGLAETASTDPDAIGGVVDVLSAGERRWFDEAMHTAAVTIFDSRTLARVIAEMVWKALNERGDDVWSMMVRAFQDGALSVDQVEDLQLLLIVGGDDSLDPASAKWFVDTVTKFQSLFEDRSRAAHPAPAAVELDDWLSVLDSPGRNDIDPSQRQRIDTALRGLWKAVNNLRGPRARVRVFDEPEAHLHSGAVARIAEALTALGQTADVLIASHHPRFIYQPEWTPYHMRIAERTHRTVLGSYQPVVAEKRNEVAVSLGLTPGEALAGTRGTLLVEGEHDRRILLESPFGPALADAGVVVQPVRGVNQFSSHRSGDLSEIALESVLMFARGIVGVMFDNDADQPTRQTYEQKVMERFIREAQSRGLQVERVGLSRPDIVAYLNPTAVHAGVSWDPIVEEFRASGRPRSRTGSGRSAA